MRHLDLIADGLIAAVKSHVGAAIGPLVARLNELDAALKAIPAGKDGAPGPQGVPGERGEKGVDGTAGPGGEPGPPGPPGEPGERGSDGAPGMAGKSAYQLAHDDACDRFQKGLPATGQPFQNETEWLASLRGEKGDPGAPGPAGPPGKDASPVDRADLAAMVAAAVDAIPRPKDGEPGKSVTPDDVRVLLAPLVNQWALDFERRAQGVFAAAIERMPKAKDGKDGFDLEDLDAALEEDGRTLLFRFVRGDLAKEWRFKLAVPLDRGIYRPDATYDKGDCVSVGGSGFVAQKDAPAGKPGESDDWRLFVKRGRDGKDGKAVGTGGHEIVRLHA